MRKIVMMAFCTGGLMVGGAVAHAGEASHPPELTRYSSGAPASAGAGKKTLASCNYLPKVYTKRPDGSWSKHRLVPSGTACTKSLFPTNTAPGFPTTAEEFQKDVEEYDNAPKQELNTCVFELSFNDDGTVEPPEDKGECANPEPPEPDESEQ